MDLVIMAAGMGSRFGGLKQIEPMNDDGDFIIDFSIFDAIRCGFEKVVFIIKEENYDIFRETVGKRIEDKIKVEYVFQRLENIPAQFMVPKERLKPWGTGHAILACKDVVKNNFVIINADDFYGFDAFKVASEFIKNNKNFVQNKFGLVGYKVCNTLSKFGSAKRGVCEVDKNNLLSIDESSVEEKNGTIIATSLESKTSRQIEKDKIVSMNMWCLNPTIFEELESGFIEFLEKNLKTDPLKCEYLIPTIISNMIAKGKVKVDVVNTNATWYGVTYKEDKQSVVEALKNLSEKGVYPKHLWKK